MAMMLSVFGEEAALYTVRLKSGETLELIRLGKRLKLNRKTSAAIVREEDTKA